MSSVSASNEHIETEQDVTVDDHNQHDDQC